jgi:cysteine desulfurase
MTTRQIYLDNQASTPTDPEVVDAMAPYWTADFGNPHSMKHAYGWRADDAVTAARQCVADMIGSSAEEIIFTSGATEANNLAILGLLQHSAGAGLNIVVSAIEHKCVLESSRQLSRDGYEIRTAPVSASGHVDLESIARLIDDRTALVCIMLVNNEIGTVQPISKIAAMCRAVGAVVHCDAAQATTGIAIDVDALGVDMLSLSAHKMYGPKGIGALFISHSVRNRLHPIIYGGGQEGGLRSGTLPTPLCVGFGKAALIVRERRDRDLTLLTSCKEVFLETLRGALSAISVNGADPRHPGHLNMRLPGVDADILTANLQPAVAISTGAACSSGIPEPSHVLRALGLDADAASECVRVGFGRFMEVGQARAAAEILAKEALRLKHGQITQNEARY